MIDTVPEFCANINKEEYRSLGFVSTPYEIVDFIIHLAGPCKDSCSVLDPACGDARFLKQFALAYGKNHRFVGIDINLQALNCIKFDRNIKINLINTDFLLWDTSERFDIIIGNPPYGIIGDASHYPIYTLKNFKKEYKKRFVTWSGKYNVYGAFIEKAINLLKQNGRLVFIVPTTWLILDDFKYLRKFLAKHGLIEVFYVGKVFPKINVSAVVLKFTKGQKGLKLYNLANNNCFPVEVKLNHLLPSCSISKSEYEGELIRFDSPEWIIFERSGIPLGSLFNIHFAARSPEYRKSGLLSNVPQKGYVPVLTGRNLKAGKIDYDNCFSGWWIPKKKVATLRHFYSFPHLVVGHTKGTKLVCAIDWKCYPWREEYHLVPHTDVKIDLQKLEIYLNSEQIQEYLQNVYQDFTPHLTRTMLQLVPVPKQIVKFDSYNLFTIGEKNGKH